MNYKSLIFAVGALAFLIMILAYCVFSMKKYHYRFYHNYPGELIDNTDNKPFSLAVLILFVSCSILCFYFGFEVYETVLGLIAGIMLGVTSLLLLPLTIINDQHRKTHTILSYIFYICSAMSSILVGFAGIIESPIVMSPALPLPVAIIFLVIGLCEVILILYPKIWTPTYLLKTEEDGKTIYVRPKFLLPALYEWIYVGLLIIEIMVVLGTSLFLKW